MAAIISSYSVYAHYYQRCMRAFPGRACMYVCGKRDLQCFALSDSFLCPIDCGPAVRGRIGWISWQVTFRESFVIALTYHCLCLGDRRGECGRSYRCSSFGGRCTYIYHLFQRMLLSCDVWSAYGSPIACASWIERLYVCMGGEAYFAYCVVRFLFLSGILGMVAPGSRSGRPCLHASIAVPRGPFRIHGFLT